MAKLLIETIDIKDLSILTEDIEENGSKEKVYKLKGIMLQSEVVNRNGRKYPKPILEREIKRYTEEKISTKRSVGTLDHGATPNIDMDRISHIIESLTMEGNDVIGVAKVLSTPCGNILKALMKDGVVTGMSSRALGEIDTNNVVKDSLELISVDSVITPSGPKCYVESIVENREWIANGDKYIEAAISNLQSSMDKKYSGKDISNYLLNHLNTFLNTIKSNK